MKKKLTSVLSVVFALALVLSVFAITVSANQTYKDVDYSTFISNFYNGEISSAAPVITEVYDDVNGYSRSGSANGFYTYFHKGINYDLVFNFEGKNAAYI